MAAASNIVITTALIPGREAPKLIEEHMVANMRPGSVIVDMAAEMGGNCTLTRKGEIFEHPDYGVIIIGLYDLVSRMAP
jgi:NAD/NADP transhydrogenase alpha subunit